MFTCLCEQSTVKNEETIQVELQPGSPRSEKAASPRTGPSATFALDHTEHSASEKLVGSEESLRTGAAPEACDSATRQGASTPGGKTFEASPSGFSRKSPTQTLTELLSDNVLLGLPSEVRHVLVEASRLRLEEFKHFAAETQVYKLINRLEAEGDHELLQKVRDTQVYIELVRDMELVNADLEALLDDQGWTAQKEAQGIHVWTRPEPGSDSVSVRIAGVQEGPFAEYCAIGKEVPLYKDWMTGVRESTILFENGHFEFVAFYLWKFPFIQAREFLLQEVTMVNDDQAYCMNRRYPPMSREEFEFQVPQVQRSHIRCAIDKSISVSVPLGRGADGKNYIFIIIVLNIDMKMPLPRKLTNLLSVKVGFDSFIQSQTNLRKAQEKNNPWHLSCLKPENEPYYGRMSQLEKARESQPISCAKEIVETGWVKDPEERKKIFARSENVLVPMK